MDFNQMLHKVSETEVEVRPIGKQLISVEKVFTNLVDALAYARQNGKRTVYTKGVEFYI